MDDVKQYDVRFSQRGLDNALEVWTRLKMNRHINSWEWKSAGPNTLTYVTPRLPWPEWTTGHEVLDGTPDRDLEAQCSRVFALLYRHALSLATDDGVLYTDAHPANIMLGPHGHALLIDPKHAIAWTHRQEEGEGSRQPGSIAPGWEPEFANTPKQSHALLIGYAIACVAESVENYIGRLLARGRRREAVERAMVVANQTRAAFTAQWSEELDTIMPVSIWGRTAWHHTLSPDSPVQMNIREALAIMGVRPVKPTNQPDTHQREELVVEEEEEKQQQQQRDHRLPRRRQNNDGGRWDCREKQVRQGEAAVQPATPGEQESTRPWLSFSWGRK